MVKKVDREAPEQRLAFQYMQVKYPQAFKMAFHVPNGGQRNKIVAAKLKAEGVKAGVPDICVALPRGQFHGLFVEMKAKPPHASAVSPFQKQWLAQLQAVGYRTVVCKGFQEFRIVIDEYMALPIPSRKAEVLA